MYFVKLGLIFHFMAWGFSWAIGSYSTGHGILCLWNL
jgi:hypothetical protein